MIVATFNAGETKTYTKSQFQYDKGQRLSFEGIGYPENCEVHFSDERDNAIAFAVKMKDGSAKIPDVFFETGNYIRAWLYATEKSTATKGHASYHLENDTTDPDGDDRIVLDNVGASKKGYDQALTLYEVVIPIIRRSRIFRVTEETDSDSDPDTPEDMDYTIHNEDMTIHSMGNDGEGNPSIQNYEVNGENFVFTRP